MKHLNKRPTLIWVLAILWLSAIAILAFLWNLGNIGLVDETEPLFAEAARQMTLTGDWITPYWNNQTRFDKPPLIYWLMAIAYQAIGVNEWAARLPSAIAAIALTCLGFYTLFKYGTGEDSSLQKPHLKLQTSLTPWIGSALIALNPETIAWGRVGVSDMLLSGCMGSALFAFFLGYAEEKKPENSTVKSSNFLFKFLPIQGWYITFYILVALAILTKGPVGIVIPTLIISSFTFYLGNFKEVWQEMRPLRGLSIVLAIALPWYILVTLANGEAFINSFFGYHNIQRFTQVVNRHSAPWYFYFVVVLAGFFPWSIYLPLAIARLRFWQRTYWRRQPRSGQLGLFALFWFGCIFGFFTISVTKLPSYVLPLMPAAAILAADLWSNIIESKIVENAEKNYQNSWFFPSLLKKEESEINPRFLFVSFALNSILLLAVAAAIFYSFHWLGDDPAMPNFPQVIQQSGLLIRGSSIWVMAAIAIALLLWRRKQHWIFSVNLLAFVAFMIFSVTPAYALVDRERQLPLRQLAQIAIEQKLPEEELIMIGFPKPSLVFYTKETVTYHKLVKGAIEHITASQNRPPASVLVIGYPSKLTELGLEPNQYQSLGIVGAYQLSRVSKQVFVNQ